MRVSLLWNPDAGDGVSLPNLRREIARAGHTLTHVVEPDQDLAPLADAELAVAAGGDGTVRKLARALARRGGVLAILPLGTANNVADQLGIEGPLAELIGRWHRARRVPLDLGTARGVWGESRFLESVGGGLVSRGIVAMDAAGGEDESADAELARALETFRSVLTRLAARPVRLTVDGVPTEGRFLLVEAMNVRATGPNLVLAPEASPSDGYLTVVTAGEEHRDRLVDYLRARGAGDVGQLALDTRLARRVEIEGLEEVHVDDATHGGAEVGTVSVELQPGALRVLV